MRSAPGIDAGQAAALGDGANDIEMIRAAGLGVAYQGKPVTRVRPTCVRRSQYPIPHLLRFRLICRRARSCCAGTEERRIHDKQPYDA